MEPGNYLTVSLKAIGHRYSDLRIIQPQADSAMERSLRRYGQLTPVVIGREADKSFEMVDGFKRLRAARKLDYPSLQARIIAGGRRMMKAAIIHLNTRARTIADIEMGLVIRSLHRHDQLSQVQIAVLLDRHKSFVCRRLKLVEQLNAEVLEHLKLGLINITIARELSRLPAGNQSRALATIVKYRFTGAEARRLATLLLTQPQWNHDAITGYPASILTERQPDRPRQRDGCGFYDRLLKMEVFLATVSAAQLKSCQPEDVLTVIEHIETALAGIRKRLS